MSKQKESKEDKGSFLRRRRRRGGCGGVSHLRKARPSTLWRALVSLRGDWTNQPDGREKQQEAEELTPTGQRVKTTSTGAPHHGPAAQMEATKPTGTVTACCWHKLNTHYTMALRHKASAAGSNVAKHLHERLFTLLCCSFFLAFFPSKLRSPLTLESRIQQTLMWEPFCSSA